MLDIMGIWYAPVIIHKETQVKNYLHVFFTAGIHFVEKSSMVRWY